MDISSSSNFESITLEFNIPSALKNKSITVYRFDEAGSVWRMLSSGVITSTEDTVLASINSFSMYGIFRKGLLPAKNLDSIHIFPNPFKPNDGNPLTGVEFTGSYNVNNASGIHISGITASTEIEIYTISGRLVKKIKALPNQGMAIWDGKNSKGIPAASGTYMLLLKVNGIKKIEKSVIIR